MLCRRRCSCSSCEEKMSLKRSLAFCGTLISIIVLISVQIQYHVVSGEFGGESGGGGGVDDELATSTITSDTVLDSTTITSSSSSSTSDDDDDVVVVEEEEGQACPCIRSSECPRVYGSNPLDFSEIGHVDPCTEEGYVRCCGVSVS